MSNCVARDQSATLVKEYHLSIPFHAGVHRFHSTCSPNLGHAGWDVKDQSSRTSAPLPSMTKSVSGVGCVTDQVTRTSDVCVVGTLKLRVVCVIKIKQVWE